MSGRRYLVGGEATLLQRHLYPPFVREHLQDAERAPEKHLSQQEQACVPRNSITQRGTKTATLEVSSSAALGGTEVDFYRQPT